jgi:type II secretory pathway component PulF
MVAAHVEGGCRLHEALLREPRMLPAPMTAMIQAAALHGNLKDMLPACRNLLKDGLSQGHSAMNWQPLLFFILSPAQLWLVWVLLVFINPQLQAVLADMAPATAAPEWFRLMHQWHWLWLGAVALMYAFLLGALLTVVGGPRLGGWLRLIFGAGWDALMYALPWRRHRMHRDFATLLSLGLDRGMPEDQAVQQAASCTVNQRFIRKADRVLDQLRQGVPLPQAIRSLDHRQELAWRLTNALRQPGQHHAALAGWCAALEAKAFQQEQAATQSITTGLVLLNGLTVGLLALGVFSVLITILEEALLW